MHEHSGSKGEVKPEKKRKEKRKKKKVSLPLSQCLYIYSYFGIIICNFFPISFSNDMNRCDLRDKTGNVASIWPLFNAPLSRYCVYHACIYIYIHVYH